VKSFKTNNKEVIKVCQNISVSDCLVISSKQEKNQIYSKYTNHSTYYDYYAGVLVAVNHK